MPIPSACLSAEYKAEKRACLLAAALLLRAAEQEERGGLSRRNAVLSALTEVGLDPALILRRAREVQA